METGTDDGTIPHYLGEEHQHETGMPVLIKDIKDLEIGQTVQLAGVIIEVRNI